MTELADVAAELYGLSPADFTRERNERAKALKGSGDAELAAAVKALPRPSVSAWLVNAMVRHLGEDLNDVLELGEELRQAQADLDAAELRALAGQRRALVSALARQGRALGERLGQKVSPTVLEQVAGTLNAAMLDEDAAAALRTGLLVAPMTASGVGSVDLTEVLAVPDAAGRAGPPPADAAAPLAKKRAAKEAEAARAREEMRRLVAEAQQMVAAAEARAAATDKARRRAEEQVKSVQAHVLQARAEAEELRRRLEIAERAVEKAEGELADAEEERDTAVRHEKDAREAVEEARRQLAEWRERQKRG